MGQLQRLSRSTSTEGTYLIKNNFFTALKLQCNIFFHDFNIVFDGICLHISLKRIQIALKIGTSSHVVIASPVVSQIVVCGESYSIVSSRFPIRAR